MCSNLLSRQTDLQNGLGDQVRISNSQPPWGSVLDLGHTGRGSLGHDPVTPTLFPPPSVSDSIPHHKGASSTSVWTSQLRPHLVPCRQSLPWMHLGPRGAHTSVQDLGGPSGEVHAGSVLGPLGREVPL